MKVTRVTSIAGLLAAVLAGCAADDKTPSCQQAFDHFYTAHCTLIDRSSGTEIPEATAVTTCTTLATDAPKTCRDELSAWLSCTNEVPSPATSDSDCSCSVELAALQSCQ
jgi:hypothetical protein